MEPLRVLELYSGIGGMHYALQASNILAEIVAAVDVNTVANEVYTHNFCTTPLWPKTIEVSKSGGISETFALRFIHLSLYYIRLCYEVHFLFVCKSLQFLFSLFCLS
uniref:DNA methyltransferase 2 n=1 Tax=Anolis carolinensis TaxID=28377 RepID=A0A803TD37_ANOCA